MNEKLQNVLNKITSFTQAKYMKILTNSFMSIAAISIAGSIFSLVKSFPIAAWQSFLTSSGLGDLLAIPISVASDLTALYIVLALGYNVGKTFEKDGFATAIIATGAFMILTPFSSTVYSADYSQSMEASSIIPLRAVGAQGIFLGIIVGIGASRLYVFFLDKGWKIKMPDSVPPAVANMFEMMIPGGLTYIVFMLIRWVFSLTSFGTAQSFIYTVLQTPLMAVGGGLAGVLVYLFSEKFLWLFGVHGGMVAYSAMATIMKTATAANASAYAAGTACPYPEWAYASVFMDYSVFALALAMLIVCKSEQYKTLSRLAIAPAAFNISEPLVFGLPVIMNPVIALPFVLLQPIDLLLTLFVTNIGLLPLPNGVTVSTVLPAFIQMGFLTGSARGIIWGLVLLAMNVLVYIPFVKVLDNKALKEETAEANA